MKSWVEWSTTSCLVCIYKWKDAVINANKDVERQQRIITIGYLDAIALRYMHAIVGKLACSVGLLLPGYEHCTYVGLCDYF